MIKFRLTATEPKLPKWAEVIFYDHKVGEIYLPGKVGGASEAAIVLAMGYDGTSFLRDGGHIYAPLSWMRREYPKLKAEFDRIEARILEEVRSGRTSPERN